MPGEPGGFEVLRLELLAHGIELRTDAMHPNEAATVTAALGLPEAIANLYARSGPGPSSSIPWVIEEMFLYSVRELPAAQEGYRWSGPDQRVLTDWHPNWVVVASLLGDPFFVDVADARGPVLFARHGAGRWEAKRVAPGFAQFIEALAAFEGVLLGDFDSDVWTEDGLRGEFLDAVETRLARGLAGEELQAFMSAIAD
jgi:hypothetical protein